MGAFRHDVRDALRSLGRDRGPSALMVMALALGIGASTTIFSLVDLVLFRPLAVERPEELFRIFSAGKGTADFGRLSFPGYLHFRNHAATFSSLAAYLDQIPVQLQAQGHRAERVVAGVVTGTYFELLGVHPAAGRLLTSADDRIQDGHPVLVLSDHYRRRRFRSAGEAVGAVVKLNGRPFTVIGVAPTSFMGIGLDRIPDVWAPMSMASEVNPILRGQLKFRENAFFDVVGRLQAGRSREQAQAELEILSANFELDHPGEASRRPRLVPAAEAAGRESARISRLALGIALLALAIACIDAAGLLLARAERREREIAIRLALGSPRSRIVRQLLVEGIVVAGLGAAVGIAVAAGASRLALAAAPPELPIPLGGAISILDRRVLVFTASVSILAGILLALAPASAASRVSLLPALKTQGPVAGGSTRNALLRGAFVVGQIAASWVLLVGTGLLVGSLRNAARVRPGFEIENRLLASIDLSLAGPATTPGSERLERIAEAARAVPGVRQAALTTSLPLGRSLQTGVEIEGLEAPAEGFIPVAINMVSAGYFEALGIAIVRGRGLSPSDRRNAPRVAVVNRELAERFWPGQDPIGKRIKGIGMQNAAAEIVGVCSNIKTRDLRERWLPTVHVPLQQFYEDTFYFRPSTTLILWTSIDARAVMQPLVQSVERLEPDVPLVHVRTLSEQVGAALASERFLAGLLTASSTLALILAAAGIYGLVSYTTEGRRREFGVRLALGARRSDIVRLVLGQSLRLVALGLALGIGGAMLFAQLLSSFLFGLDPIDPLTFSSAGMLLVSIALAAGSVPARRAASVDPTTLLRTE